MQICYESLQADQHIPCLLYVDSIIQVQFQNFRHLLVSVTVRSDFVETPQKRCSHNETEVFSQLN